MKKSLLIIAALFYAGVLPAQQILLDRKEEVALTKQALRMIYNFEFDSAGAIISDIEELTGPHPGICLLQAISIFWNFQPLTKGSEEYYAYEKLLAQSAEQSEKFLAKDEMDLEGVFFSLAANGYLAAFYADEGSPLKAISSARKAYSSLKKGFILKDEFSEFYFTTGLYNYYREKYPENHPVYKSFMWIFASGDKQLGIDQLKKASQEAVFTRIESYYYLFHTYLRYEKDPVSALNFTSKLVEKHPRNPAFQAYHAEALAVAGRYVEAAAIVDQLKMETNAFYALPAAMLDGIILEKKEGNYDQAEASYRKAIEMAGEAGFDTDHYASMAWAGLARIHDQKGNQGKAKEYYNKALKLSSYDIVMDEAREYLK